MNMEQRERRPQDELRGVMSGAVRQVTEQSSELMQSALQALKDGQQVDVASLIAAFDLNANLSQALKQFLESRGQVVFPEGQSIRPPAIDGEVDKDEPSLPEGLKTFGDLLRAKIDGKLLPKDNDSFAKSEIFEVAKDTSGVRRAALAEGISAHQRKLTREQVIKVLYRFFTTPPGHFRKKQESYSLQEFKKSFVRAGSLINELSQEINYDWTQNPTIDYQTAMELRGLVNLEKVITGEKVAKKGNPGAQLEKRSVFSSTPSTEAAFPNQP